MAALDFPASPSVGQQYPSPAVSGQPVYTWDGEKWTTKGGAIGSTGAFNGSPLANGTAAPGASTEWARGDHVHPTDPAIAAGDALRAPIASPTFTGDPKAPTPAIGDNDTSIATTAFVNQAVPILSGVDFNTILNPGTYVTNNVSSNANEPTGAGQWYLHVLAYAPDPGYRLQVAYSLITDGLVYMRKRLGGTWGNWFRLLDASLIAAYTDIYANVAGKIVTTDQMWATGTFSALSDAAAAAGPDFNASINWSWTLGGAGKTLANPTNAKQGQSGLIYINAGASGTITTWGSAWWFPGAVKPVLTIGGADCIAYTVRTTGIIICSFLKNMG